MTPLDHNDEDKALPDFSAVWVIGIFLLFPFALIALLISSSSANGQNYKAGRDSIEKTWVSPATQGWKIAGSGSSTPINGIVNTGHGLNATRFVVLPGVSPAILAQGAHWQIKDLTYYGNGSGTAVHVCHTRKEFNSTKNIISNVGIGNFEIGIDLSEPHQHGNDNLIIRDCQIGNCSLAAIRINSNQAVKSRVENLNAGGCGAVVLAENGGSIVVNGLDLGSDGTLLQVTADGKGVAENNGTFTFRDIRADNRNGSTFTIIRKGHPSARYHCLIENLHLPSPKGKGLRATLTGNDQHLTLDRAINIPKDTVLDPGPGTITVKNCILPIPPQDMLPKESTGILYVVNCTYQNELITGRYGN